MLEYRAAYYRDDEPGITVQVLDFPGAITEGKDLDDARAMVKDAIRLLAEGLLEDGEPLPRPNPDATDPEAFLIEPVRVGVRVRTGTGS